MSEAASDLTSAPEGRRQTINLRVDEQTRRLIDSAAVATGKSRTEFMLDVARRHAVDVLLDQRLFTLNDADFDAFSRALDHPPAPGAKLKATMRRTPVWNR